MNTKRSLFMLFSDNAVPTVSQNEGVLQCKVLQLIKGERQGEIAKSSPK